MTPAIPSSANGSTGSHQAGGYVVRSRTALLSAMLIGNRRTATIESALRITGSMFPTMPLSPNQTGPAERWSGRRGLKAKSGSGASCRAVWARCGASVPVLRFGQAGPLRDLYEGLYRARARPGVQLAGCAIRGRLRLHQKPGAQPWEYHVFG